VDAASRAAVVPAGPQPTALTVDPATCGISVPLAPEPRPARSAADADWPYRGEPDLRDDAVRAGTQARLTQVRPLFGASLSDGARVLVFAGRHDDGRWQWQYTVDGVALPGPDSPTTGGGGPSCCRSSTRGPG
jgi:hypothetical protein